jgi:hypothetical protein
MFSSITHEWCCNFQSHNGPPDGIWSCLYLLYHRRSCEYLNWKVFLTATHANIAATTGNDHGKNPRLVWEALVIRELKKIPVCGAARFNNLWSRWRYWGYWVLRFRCSMSPSKIVKNVIMLCFFNVCLSYEHCEYIIYRELCFCK